MPINIIMARKKAAIWPLLFIFFIVSSCNKENTLPERVSGFAVEEQKQLYIGLIENFHFV